MRFYEHDIKDFDEILCNAPVAILLFLVDFNMFGVFLYENVELCEYVVCLFVYNKLCEIIELYDLLMYYLNACYLLFN